MTVAGIGSAGSADGPALSSSFDYPRSVIADPIVTNLKPDLFVADTVSHTNNNSDQ